MTDELNDLPSLEGIIIKAVQEKETIISSKRDYVRNLRWLVSTFGKIEIAKRLNKSIDWIEELIGYGKNRDKENDNLKEIHQIKCINCNGIVLVPLVRFNSGKESNGELIRRFINCIHCRTPLGLFIERGRCKTAVTMLDDPIKLEEKWSRKVKNITGVTMTTNVYYRKNYGMKRKSEEAAFNYLVRVGFAIMGAVNIPATIEACPFDNNFHDNYIEIIVNDLNEIPVKMNDQLESIAKGFFHE